MSLLRPEAVLSKIIAGGGEWGVRKPRYGAPAFCLMLQGSCVLQPDGLDAIELRHGDFVLFPETPSFTLAAHHEAEATDAELDHARHTRHGPATEPVTMRMLGGYFRFDPAHAPLLVALLPRAVLIRHDEPGSGRLSRIVELIADEADTASACRDVILQRLVEVLLIEAMRAQTTPAFATGQRGLIAGLSDPVLAPALHRMHADLAHGWTVEQLARAASVSRAVFAQRFTRTIGMPPMQYLVEWRIALAKELLRTEQLSTAQAAGRVGYQSASAFTTAFTRVTGCSPSEFGRQQHAIADTAEDIWTTAPGAEPSRSVG
jgi:AraC-like DNA-binding protein